MRALQLMAFVAPATLLCSPALAEPVDSDLTATVAKAMDQAGAVTDAVRTDAAAAGERMSQPSTQALYARYHTAGANNASGDSAAPRKPCDHPHALETGGLCIPLPAGH